MWSNVIERGLDVTILMNAYSPVICPQVLNAVTRKLPFFVSSQAEGEAGEAPPREELRLKHRVLDLRWVAGWGTEGMRAKKGGFTNVSKRGVRGSPQLMVTCCAGARRSPSPHAGAPRWPPTCGCATSCCAPSGATWRTSRTAS